MDWTKHKQICNKMSTSGAIFDSIAIQQDKNNINNIPPINHVDFSLDIDKFNRVFEFWFEFNIFSLKLIVSQYLHAKIDFELDHVLDVRIKMLRGQFEIISANIKSFTSLNQNDVKLLTTSPAIGRIQSQCGIIASFILPTNLCMKTIVIEMDKSQDYKLATQEKQSYIDSINNGNGNNSNDYTLIIGNIISDIQQKCDNCCELSKKGKKLMCCSICFSAHYCSKECQKSDWKIHKLYCNNLKEQRNRMKNGITNDIRKKLNNWMEYNLSIFQLMVSNYLHTQIDPLMILVFCVHVIYEYDVFKVIEVSFQNIQEFSETNDINISIEESKTYQTMRMIPIFIYYKDVSKFYSSIIDKLNPYLLATENIDYYINIVNSGQSKICKAYKLIQLNTNFQNIFELWFLKNYDNFQLMSYNYIKQNNLIKTNNKVTDIMKITINGENCYIESAVIQPIDSLLNKEQSCLETNDLLNAKLDNSLHFWFISINPKLSCVQIIENNVLSNHNDYSIESCIEIINNNSV